MSANQQQFEAWNGGESAHYVDHADRYDRQLAPYADALLADVRPASHHTVLDVGCGCGATTLEAARRARRAVGIDISAPLLEVAVDRAGAASLDEAEFVVADAQTHAFSEGSFDLIISQFGLMFFDDPVSAFENLHRSLVPGGRLGFVCWRGLEANEWLVMVGDAVGRYTDLPTLGGLDGGPGMFALEQRDETAALLDAAGFGGIEIESLSPSILIGGGGPVDESVDFLLGMGMVRGLLGRLELHARAEAIDALRSSLGERYEPGVGVRLGSAGWLVSAGA